MFLRRLFHFTAVLLLVWGAIILLRTSQHIGRTYGGFIIIHDLSMEPPFYVGYFPWRTIRSSPFFLQAFDHLLSIHGAPPERYPAIYAAARPGDPIEYRVERNGKTLTIVEPAHIFSADIFFIIFGMHYLLLLIVLLTGYVLSRPPCPPYRRVLSLFSLLPAIAMIHSLWAMDSFDGPPTTSSYWFGLLSAPVPGLGGAMVLHSLLLYLWPQSTLLRRAWVAALLYAPPLMLGALIRVVIELGPQGRMTFVALLQTIFIYGTLCLGATPLLALYRYPLLRRSQPTVVQKGARAMLIALGVLLVALVVFWWVPFMLSGGPLIPYEILIAMGITYPLGLIYAIFHSNLLSQAERKAQEAEALRRTREQMLHHIADRIHDRVLPELQGARMLIEALPLANSEAMQQERLMAMTTLQGLVREMRAILDTTKPINWSQHSLTEVFAWLVQRMQALHPHVPVHLAVDHGKVDPSPQVKEAIYHVALAALNNALTHAQAHTIWLRLRSERNGIWLEVEDDGVGFDLASIDSFASDRRHMGLESMRFHAAEVGGDLTIESHLGKGTLVRLHVFNEFESGTTYSI